MAEAPTTIAQLRRVLGRTGLLDSREIAIVQALPDEVPNLPGVTIFGWVTMRAETLVTDRRGRVVITLTDSALASLKTAVETVGHELHHIGEKRAGAGASEKAAEAAANAYVKSFLLRLDRLQ